MGWKGHESEVETFPSMFRHVTFHDWFLKFLFFKRDGSIFVFLSTAILRSIV